jgi:arylamine N-acetyltransferase
MSIGEHFYTTSEAERDNAVSNLGYQSEGIACYVYASQASGAIPLFRLIAPNGNHFYTTSEAERQNAISSFGYQSEGIACYVLDSDPSSILSLFRMLNPNYGDHFYTTDLLERDNAVSNLGYQSEGIACYVYASQASGTMPLFRLLDPQNGSHFYTTSEAERDNAVSNLGYQSEGIACYVYASQASGTMPLFRLLDPQNGSHFYTTSEAERDNAIANLGYQSEGVSCFVMDSDPSSILSLFRMLNRNNGDHFYTTDLLERDNAISNLGYQSEGIACYVYASQASETAPLFRLLKVRVVVKTSFRPSRDGFAFANSWHFDQFEKDKIHDLIRAAATPVMLALAPLLVPALGILDAIGVLFGIPPGTIETAAAIALLSGKLNPLIDSALPETYGLCGGMSYAALDYFNLNWVVDRGYPGVEPQRSSMEARMLRDYIWTRLIDSLAGGVAQTTLEWLALLHFIPEGSGGGAAELLKRSKTQWDVLKGHIGAGEPWPIGLIGTTSNPMHDHQVVAYGYEDNGDNSGLIWIYDNNHPDQEVTINLDFGGTELQAEESHPNANRGPLKGFFCEPYAAKVPPVALGLSQGISASVSGESGQNVTLAYEATNFGFGQTQPLKLYVRGQHNEQFEFTSKDEDNAGPMPIDCTVLPDGHPSGKVVSRQLRADSTLSGTGSWTFYPVAYLPTVINEPVFKTIPAGVQGQPDRVVLDLGPPIS